MKTVMHIAAHMGGGVGKVLSNVAKYPDDKYDHRIILLEEPIDTEWTDTLPGQEIITIKPTLGSVREAIGESDIVHLDWWGHPAMNKLLPKLSDIPIRLVIWSHINGCYEPHYLKPEVVKFPHRFMFTSQYSRENPKWMLNDLYEMDSTSVVCSSGGFENTRDVPLKKHPGFNVGYIGAQDFTKLDIDFVDWCATVADIPDIKFVMIGKVEEPNLIGLRAELLGIASKFEFKGYVRNLPQEMAELDVLGHLLSPYHYGTTENAMLEAMSMGIPVVAKDQCAEKYLIRHGDSGYLVRDKKEYRNAILTLYANRDIRSVIGRNGRQHVISSLDLHHTITGLDRVYDTVMRKPKRTFNFGMIL